MLKVTRVKDIFRNNFPKLISNLKISHIHVANNNFV